MLTCPLSSCDHPEQPDVGTLAAHLAEAHLVAPSEAMRRAREVREMSTPKEARPMAIPDGVKRCSFCKHTGHVYAECSGAKAHREKKRTAPKPAASMNDFADALVALRAKRTELDAVIVGLERLGARGR